MRALEELVEIIARFWILTRHSSLRYVLLFFIAILVGLFVRDQIRQKRQFAAALYQGVTLNNEKGTLHLLERGAPDLQHILLRMRVFETAEQVYYYVYEQFGEAAFEHLRIHRSDGRAEDFTRDGTQSNQENVSRLQQVMFG